MKPLEIEVLWHTDETRKLSDSGLDYDPDSLERRTMTFYHIDAIAPDIWNEQNKFCYIYAGGDKWISAFTYEETKSLIENNK